MTVEIEIPRMGTQPGSCGWLAERLKDVSFEIATTKHSAALFVRWGGDLTTFVCQPYRVEDAARFQKVTVEGHSFQRSYAQDDGKRAGVFAVPFTPAAKRALNEFLQAATVAFARQWISDGIPTDDTTQNVIVEINTTKTHE